MTVWFRALVLATALGIPLYAWAVRGRVYAIFATVILAIALPGAVAMHERYLALAPAELAPVLSIAFLWGLVAAALHLGSLVTARLRSPAFRIGVSIPGMVFVAAGALSGVWLLAWLPVRALVASLGMDGVLTGLRLVDLVPFAVAVASVATSKSFGCRPSSESRTPPPTT